MVLSVAVDATCLADGSQYRGIGTYLRNVLAGLEERDDVDVVALAGRGVDLPSTVSRGSPGPLRRWGKRRAPRNAQVWWSPAQSPPRRSALPWVQTLHDLTPLVWDDPMLTKDRDRWQKVGPRLKDAAAVICPSHSAARQCRDLLGVSESRLHVIAHGVTGPPTTGSTHRLESGRPYLLVVSAWGPHKGFADAFAVMDRLVEDGLPHQMVVVGLRDDWSAGNVRRLRDSAGHPDRIDIAGYVDDLAAVYRGAGALLVTSRAEGFGLPVLEAMACGTPVVSYDNTALPEAVGDAGLLVGDGDTVAMAAAVRRMLDDDRLRRELIDRGRRRAAAHTWRRSVGAHVDVLREAAGE